MKTHFRDFIPEIHLNIIDRDLLLLLISALGVSIAFFTVTVMVVSRF